MRRWVPIVALLGLAWCGRGVLRGRSDEGPRVERIGEHTSSGGPRTSGLPRLHGRSATLPAPSAGPGDTVSITGTVIDRDSHEPVGDVEVVLRSADGEEATQAAADGTYRLDVPVGSYRIYVRDELVLSLGSPGRDFIPDLDASDTVGVPDEAAMPLVLAHADLTGVDLTVVRGGVIAGKVLDPAGRPIARAVVRVHRHQAVERPVLGELAETDASGSFELVVPPGMYTVDASHAQFAGVVDRQYVEVDAGAHQDATLTLTAGCVVLGRVVRPDGSPAGEGAIELQHEVLEGEPPQFGAASRIAADGSFRWFTTEEQAVTLRAWPWKSPPSPAQTFACKDGARFEGVVFQLPAKAPDIEGLLVDAQGAPVPNALLHITPLGDTGIPQIERTDGAGRWGVFAMPAGDYEITARVPGLGVVQQTVHAPQADVRLALGGVGRIEGTTPLLATGSFEVELGACEGLGDDTVEHRLVAVHDHRFTIDAAPACSLHVVASWRTTQAEAIVEVRAGATATAVLDVGPRPRTRVWGVVRDSQGRPVPNAGVIVLDDRDPITTTADASGRYEVEAAAGVTIDATARDGSLGYGSVTVPLQPAPREQLDIVLRDSPDGDDRDGDDDDDDDDRIDI